MEFGIRRNPVTRRRFLRTGGAALAGLWLPGELTTVLGGCDGGGTAELDSAATAHRPAPGAARELRLVAEVGEVDLGPLGPLRTWLYNGRYPGEEIRVGEGERLRVVLENRLPDPTTIHWHGVPVPNPMDGVPGITQAAVEPGDSFAYDYVAEPAGTYMYHSHVALQLDRGLLGPLIIEERSPHVQYDREYTVVLDDLLRGDPRLVQGRGSMMMGMGAAGPEYAAFLINGRPVADPAVLEVRRGERIRLRLINPASQTTFRVAIAGHRMTVIHADSRPVEPVEVREQGGASGSALRERSAGRVEGVSGRPSEVAGEGQEDRCRFPRAVEPIALPPPCVLDLEDRVRGRPEVESRGQP